MSRVAIPFVLQSPGSGSAIVGATATITQHVAGGTPGTGPPASIYLGETGTSVLTTNEVLSDSSGRFTQGAGSGFAQYWLTQGTYDVTISGGGLTPYTITREFVSANGSDEVAMAGQLLFGGWPVAPPGTLVANGAAVSRSTYSVLFAAITAKLVGTATGTDQKLTIPGLTAAAGIDTFMPICGPGIPANTTISSLNYGTGVVTCTNVIAATAGPWFVCPYGVGDGSTTFNLPTMSGAFPLGKAGGGGLLDVTGRRIGQQGGSLDHTHGIVVLPQHSHSLSAANAGAAIAVSNFGGTGLILTGQAASISFLDSAVTVASTYSATSGAANGVALYGYTDPSIVSNLTPVPTQPSNPAYTVGLWVVRTGLQ